MMILHLSDIHGHVGMVEKLEKINEKYRIELIVLTGDITHFGTAKEAIYILKVIYEKMRCKVLFVPGNCDPPELLKIHISSEIYNLHKRAFKHKKLTFVGIGGCLRSGLYSYIAISDKEIGEILEQFKNSQNLIIVSHVPPYGTKVDIAYSGKHIGSRSLRYFIEKNQPLAVLSGHVHEARGIDKINKTKIINPGPLANGYAALVSVEPSGTVSAELIEV